MIFPYFSYLWCAGYVKHLFIVMTITYKHYRIFQSLLCTFSISILEAWPTELSPNTHTATWSTYCFRVQCFLPADRQIIQISDSIPLYLLTYFKFTILSQYLYLLLLQLTLLKDPFPFFPTFSPPPSGKFS